MAALRLRNRDMMARVTLRDRPALAGLRRRLNSSPLIPGALRQALGGRIYSSADYHVLGTDRFAADEARALSGWHRATVARRQARLWADHRMWDAGRPDVRNLGAAMGMFEGVATVLEVGCGTGYNARVLGAHGGSVIGIDSSWAMLSAAEGSGCFVSGDACALPFGSRTIEVVVDGGALIHTVDWRLSLAEQARVARRGVVLHTVTTTTHPTTYLRKRAYGYPVAEIVFNAQDLRDAVSGLGLRIVSVADGLFYDLEDVTGIPTRSQTWVMRAAAEPVRPGTTRCAAGT